MAVLVGFLWLFTAHSKKPPIKRKDTYAQGKLRGREHQQKFSLNSNHAYWSLQSGQLESKTSQTVSPQMRFFRKTDSPRAKRRVHHGLLESPLQVLRVHFLSARIVQKIADSCPADGFVVFQGAHPCLHRSVCSVPNRYNKVETHIFRPW